MLYQLSYRVHERDDLTRSGNVVARGPVKPARPRSVATLRPTFNAPERATTIGPESWK